MENNQRFVLKDENEKYVGINSIRYNKEIGEYIYSWSSCLCGGYGMYTNEKDAINQLNILENKAKEIKYGMKFHIEKIDLLDIIKNEKSIGLVPPFEHEIINTEYNEINELLDNDDILDKCIGV